MRTLDSEARKLLTLPQAWVTVGLTLAVTPFLAYLVGRAHRDGNVVLGDVAATPMLYLQVSFAVLGTLSATTEYAGGQVRTSLLAEPRRIRQATAKLVVVAIVCAVFSAFVEALNVFGAWLGLGRPAQVGSIGRLFSALAGSAFFGLLLGLLAWGIAMMTRSVIATLAPLLGICLFAAPLLLRVTTAARFLPGNAGSTLVLGGVAPNQLDPLPGGLVLAAWAGVICLAAVSTFWRRDA